MFVKTNVFKLHSGAQNLLLRPLNYLKDENDKKIDSQGTGCGSVGCAVASDTRDPRFESRHWQNCIDQLYKRKDENKEKEAGNGPSLKKKIERVLSKNSDVSQSLDFLSGLMPSSSSLPSLSSSLSLSLSMLPSSLPD